MSPYDLVKPVSSPPHSLLQLIATELINKMSPNHNYIP